MRWRWNNQAMEYHSHTVCICTAVDLNLLLPTWEDSPEGTAISWTVSPSTGHQETDTVTFFFFFLSLSYDQLFSLCFLLSPCFYSQALVCRACSSLSLPMCINPPFLLTDKDDRRRFNDLKTTVRIRRSL